jgi:hypothetical protein
VGQDKDPQPLMRRADFCRAEQTRRWRIAQSPKLSQDAFKAEGDMARDVFEEDPFGTAFPDDPGNFGPEVARIVGTPAFSGSTEWLARISCEDRVEGPVERTGIEAAQIIPDWRWGEVS